MLGNSTLDYFGRDLQAMPVAVQERCIAQAVRTWRTRGFPFPTITPAGVTQEFGQLARISPKAILYNKSLHFFGAGLRLANAFHPQMWTARQYGHHKSPLDYFNDDGVLEAALTRAIRHWPNRRCWNAQCVRSAFRVYGGGRVANFRPSVARALVARYSRPSEVVLDFAAGYGGRLLGTVTLPRRYIGIDADPEQCKGLLNLWDAVREHSEGEARIINARAEIHLRSLASRSVDLVVSSPPYFSQEHYSRHPWQSSVLFPTYESWKREFLMPTLAECARVLRRGGYLILNVKDTRRFPVASDVCSVLKGHLRLRDRLALRMRERPGDRRLREPPFSQEPVLVYQRA